MRDEDGEGHADMNEQTPDGSATPAAETLSQAARQASTERLVVAEVACMVIVIAGVFLNFVPLVVVGFLLSVVAVVAV